MTELFNNLDNLSASEIYAWFTSRKESLEKYKISENSKKPHNSLNQLIDFKNINIDNQLSDDSIIEFSEVGSGNSGNEQVALVVADLLPSINNALKVLDTPNNISVTYNTTSATGTCQLIFGATTNTQINSKDPLFTFIVPSSSAFPLMIPSFVSPTISPITSDGVGSSIGTLVVANDGKTINYVGNNNIPLSTGTSYMFTIPRILFFIRNNEGGSSAFINTLLGTPLVINQSNFFARINPIPPISDVSKYNITITFSGTGSQQLLPSTVIFQTVIADGPTTPLGSLTYFGKQIGLSLNIVDVRPDEAVSLISSVPFSVGMNYLA